MSQLPLHPHLVHPLTGLPLRAIYRTKLGQLVWPQLGGDGTGTPAPPATTPPAPTPTTAPPAPAPGAPAPAPTYVPPPSLTPPAPPAPAGPTYVPTVPVPAAPPAEPDDTKDWSKLPAWARDENAKLKDENAKRRISERTAIVNQHAHYAAAQLGANAAALLGSTAFSQLATQLDPHAPDFAAKLTAAIAATVTANPWMSAQPTAPVPTPPVPPASGADFAGAGGTTAPITEAQLAQMTHHEIAAALAAGKLAHLL